MDANRHEFGNEERKLILKEEVYQFAGCALEVVTGIGHGWHAKLDWECIVL